MLCVFCKPVNRDPTYSSCAVQFKVSRPYVIWDFHPTKLTEHFWASCLSLNFVDIDDRFAPLKYTKTQTK